MFLVLEEKVNQHGNWAELSHGSQNKLIIEPTQLIITIDQDRQFQMADHIENFLKSKLSKNILML